MKQYILVIIFALLICSCSKKADDVNQAESKPIAIEETATQEVVQIQTQPSEEPTTPAIEIKPQPQPQQQNTKAKTLQQMIEGLPNNINLFGVWQMMPQAYTALYQQNGIYYMQDIYMDRCTYGDKERMVKLSSCRFRFADDTGEVFEIANGVMNGYSFGDLACQWTQVM